MPGSLASAPAEPELPLCWMPWAGQRLARVGESRQHRKLHSGNGDHVESPRPVLLYDGTCGFCAESVQLVLRHDRQKTLQFAALDSSFGRAVLGRHPELALVDSVVWYEPAHGAASERLFTRSAAALRVARYLGGAWRLATVAGLMPRFFRDFLYDLVARHRHQLVRGGQQCLVPSPDQRARFLT